MSDEITPAPRRRFRRRVVLVSLLLLVVMAAVGGWVMLAPADGDVDAATEGDDFTLEVVQRTTLTVGETVAGRIGFGSAAPIPLRAAGTVTWLPKLGAIARQGDRLMEVDGRPVVLMYGTTPAYRALDDGTDDPVPPAPDAQAPPAGTPDEPTPPAGPPAESRKPTVGEDVRQLEAGLQALGYGGFTVDEEFTSYTAAAVKRWQSDLGIQPTGRVQDGDVVFLPGPVRLQPDAAALGRAASESSVLQTGVTKVVTVQAQGQELHWAVEGEKVTIDLPDQRSTMAGRVLGASSSTSEGSESGGAPQEIVIGLARPDGRKLKPGPVTVTHVAATARDVLAVPVVALIALAEGGYGVQLESGDLVAVTPGLYADGLVEIESDGLSEGARVRLPR